MRHEVTFRFNKTVYSILVILTFFLITIASLGPDQSTNVTVAMDESKCMNKPIVFNPFTVNVSHKDKKTGVPIPFASGEIIYTKQMVAGSECKYEYTFLNQSFMTSAQGQYSHTFPDLVQNNAADLVRVEIRMEETATYEKGSAFDVRYCGPANFSFVITSLKKSDL